MKESLKGQDCQIPISILQRRKRGYLPDRLASSQGEAHECSHAVEDGEEAVREHPRIRRRCHC